MLGIFIRTLIFALIRTVIRFLIRTLMGAAVDMSVGAVIDENKYNFRIQLRHTTAGKTAITVSAC